MTRAVIFDLDETLYSERRFALSGFVAVAREVERRFDVPAGDAFRLLAREMARGRRRVALQALCRRFGLPHQTVEELRDCIRAHAPNLKLPRESAGVLRELRSEWRVGILTNGLPSTQERKIAALGLADRVDAVVYAERTGPGKPDRAAFDAIVGALGVGSTSAVFVGDDPWCDMFGARRAGLKTIWLRRRTRPGDAARSETVDADAVVTSLRLVPDRARQLVGVAVGGALHRAAGSRTTSEDGMGMYAYR